MSPLQYQKQLRLLEARRLMLAENSDAANAAYQFVCFRKLCTVEIKCSATVSISSCVLNLPIPNRTDA